MVLVIVVVGVADIRQPPENAERGWGRVRVEGDRMGNQIKTGSNYQREAANKFNASKFEDAADLYQKSANLYRLERSWDSAGWVYINLAECYLKLNRIHEAASAYADAGNCYKCSFHEYARGDARKDAVGCFKEAMKFFEMIGRYNMAGKYCVDIGELYVWINPKLKKAIAYFGWAADLFQTEELTNLVNECKLKVALLGAQLGKYSPAIEIFEELAWHSLNEELLKYAVKGHLLYAGLCQLFMGDVVALNNSLQRYQDLDPTFSGTLEYKFLADLAAAVKEDDALKFTAAVEEFERLIPLDAWITAILSNTKEALKAKELEEDSLT